MGGWARGWRRGGDRLAAKAEGLGLKAASALARRRLGVEDPGRAATAPAWAAEVLRHATAHLCDYSACAGWRTPAASAPEAIDGALAMIETMPGPTRERLWGALALFEAGPAILGPRRAPFTKLAPEDQRAYLASWHDSGLEARRAIFEAIKSVCMMGYWSRLESWPSIRYDLMTEGGFTGGVEAPGGPQERSEQRAQDAETSDGVEGRAEPRARDERQSASAEVER